MTRRENDQNEPGERVESLDARQSVAQKLRYPETSASEPFEVKTIETNPRMSIFRQKTRLGETRRREGKISQTNPKLRWVKKLPVVGCQLPVKADESTKGCRLQSVKSDFDELSRVVQSVVQVLDDSAWDRRFVYFVKQSTRFGVI